MIDEVKEEKKEGRWARKRRERRERGQKPKAKVKKEVESESYRKTARLRLQTMFKAGFGTKRSTDKMNASTQDKIYSENTFLTYKRQFKHYDNHHYRSVYAKRIYDLYARKEKDIPPKERYVMRKDRAGEVFDRLAMAVVSKNLGHNRISVVAQHYLY